MFDHDRAAARGEMTARGLIIFKHDSDLGNAPAHKLLERVTVTRADGDSPPRGFGDYAVSVNEANLPSSITLETKI
jgi:CRISPR-associated protein Csd2